MSQQINMIMDKAELKFYRALASFGKNSSNSFSESKFQASNLKKRVEKFVKCCDSQNLALSEDLLKQINSTIIRTLCNDQQLKYPQITEAALEEIYATIQFLDDYDKIWNKKNSTLVNQQSTSIFIFPGECGTLIREFVFGKFASLDNTEPKGCYSLDYVQHVVHDIDDVLSILQTISGKAHFKGFSNKDFSGPLLCWFAPLPPPWTKKSQPSCDSLDPNGSRYGCFRFTIPFKVLRQRFPTCFVLGSRKYKREHSHTILLTEQHVKYITLIEKRQLAQITDTIFIQNSKQPSQDVNKEGSLQWLCFHDDDQTEWDQLEFAVATKTLQFDPREDNIRLDFVDHDSKFCVPLLIRKGCPYSWNKSDAMKNFLIELTERNIELDTFRSFFNDDVRAELLTLKESLNLRM